MHLCACGCGRATSKRTARGHHARLDKTGITGRPRLGAEDRFWQKVMDREDPASCWLWTGALDKNGYGHIRDDDLIKMGAHRFSYRIHYGAFDSRFEVCHSCDTPQCVNPHHLFLGTRQENEDDKTNKGRRPMGEQWYVGKRWRLRAVEV